MCHCYAAELFFSVGLVNETPLNAFYSTVPVERSEFGTEKATKLKGYCFKRIFGKCVKLTSKVCSEFLHTCFRMREARKWKQFGRKLVCLLLVCILLKSVRPLEARQHPCWTTYLIFYYQKDLREL